MSSNDHGLDRVIGDRVRAARRAKGMTQTQLGAAIGVTFQQIQKYEKGSNRISASSLSRICTVLNVDAASIMPRASADGGAAPDRFAAMGASIGGHELADCYGRMTDDQRRSLLSIAKAIVTATAIQQAAASC